MADRRYELGDAELEVLKVLWEHGPATVREALTQIHARGRRVAYTTVQTLLTRLEQKGFVASDKSDFAHVFRATVRRDRVSRFRLRTLVKQLYDGAPGPAVLQLVRTGRLTPQEIRELQELIDQLDARGQPPTAKRPGRR